MGARADRIRDKIEIHNDYTNGGGGGGGTVVAQPQKSMMPLFLLAGAVLLFGEELGLKKPGGTPAPPPPTEGGANAGGGKNGGSGNSNLIKTPTNTGKYKDKAILANAPKGDLLYIRDAKDPNKVLYKANSMDFVGYATGYEWSIKSTPLIEVGFRIIGETYYSAGGNGSQDVEVIPDSVISAYAASGSGGDFNKGVTAWVNANQVIAVGGSEAVKRATQRTTNMAKFSHQLKGLNDSLLQVVATCTTLLYRKDKKIQVFSGALIGTYLGEIVEKRINGKRYYKVLNANGLCYRIEQKHAKII